MLIPRGSTMLQLVTKEAARDTEEGANADTEEETNAQAGNKFVVLG